MTNTEKHQQDHVETSHGITMVRVREDQLTPAVLEEFAELLMEGVFHPVLDVCDDTKRELGNVLLDLHPKKRPIPIDHAVRRTEDWKDYKENLIHHYQLLAADGDLIVAMDGERIVGMSGCQGIGYRRKKEVYEIVHSVVLPDYRGRGISTSLADAVMERMYEHSPDALLLTNTDNERRIQSWERHNPHVITPEEHVAIHTELSQDLRESFLQRRKAKAAEGTRIFLVPVKKALEK